MNSKKLSKAQLTKKEFYTKGNKLPVCVNTGCKNSVTVREWKYWSFKSECASCTDCRKRKLYKIVDSQKIITKGTKKTIKNDKIIHKKNFCENNDSHLNFTCPVDITLWESFLESLDLDHLDSDHMNNIPENVKTYCKLCHNRKSKDTGDWNSNKASSRNIDS
tara:strand:- start:48 stop:536 length:489 start_codon:yes stop_codon:yes gene_type:complete